MPFTEIEQRILDTFGRVLPHLDEKDKDRLLYMGKGLEIKTERLKHAEKPA